MGIQDWSENIVLADLPSEPEISDELKTILEKPLNQSLLLLELKSKMN
jgi:hypothetical protein